MRSKWKNSLPRESRDMNFDKPALRTGSRRKIVILRVATFSDIFYRQSFADLTSLVTCARQACEILRGNCRVRQKVYCREPAQTRRRRARTVVRADPPGGHPWSVSRHESTGCKAKRSYVTIPTEMFGCYDSLTLS